MGKCVMRRRIRLLSWGFALLAWFAQAGLPVAHAAWMAASGTGAAAWCGTASAGLEQQLSALPADIRQYLGGSSHVDGVENCAQLCAATSGTSLGGLPTPATLADLGNRQGPAAEQAPTWARSARITPPARGPPAQVKAR